MFDRKRLVLVISLLVVSGLMSVYLQVRAGGPAGRAKLPRGLPMEISGWQGNPFSASMPRDVGPEDYILRSYGRGNGRQVGILALYSPISNYHPPALCYQGAGQQLTEIPSLSSSSGKIRLAGLLGKRELSAILVYHGFFINGKVIPDGIEKKLYEVKEKLTRGKIDQYFFEITINVADQDHATAVRYLKLFLDDMEPHLLRPE